MYTVGCAIKDTDKLKIFGENDTFNIFSILKSVKNYESIFYNTNAVYTKEHETPLDNGLKRGLKKIKLLTKDKAELDVWDINPLKSEKYIIFCHGICSEKSNLLQQKVYMKFIKAGYGVIAFDYRGRGKSSGIFSRKGAITDVETIYQHLLNKRIKLQNTGIVGHSMGSAVAADFSAANSVAFTVLINPFSTATDMLKEIAKKTNMPELVQKIIQKLPSFLFPLNNKFDNIKALRKIKSPVCIIHTKEDSDIPVKLARKLCKKSNNKKLKYIELDGGDHEINDEKTDCCIQFIKQIL